MKNERRKRQIEGNERREGRDRARSKEKERDLYPSWGNIQGDNCSWRNWMLKRCWFGPCCSCSVPELPQPRTNLRTPCRRTTPFSLTNSFTLSFSFSFSFSERGTKPGTVIYMPLNAAFICCGHSTFR